MGLKFVILLHRFLDDMWIHFMRVASLLEEHLRPVELLLGKIQTICLKNWRRLSLIRALSKESRHNRMYHMFHHDILPEVA